MAIQHLYNQREYRFEIPSQMNATRTEAFPYLFTDYLAYLGRIHDSFQWGEFNAWADDHHVVLMKDFGNPKAFFELERQLQQKGLPYIKKGRCQFETIFVTTSDHLTIFQFKYLNLEKKRFRDTACDPEAPLCHEQSIPQAMEAYDWYFNSVRSDISPAEMIDEVIKRQDEELKGDQLPNSTLDWSTTPFDFCAGPSKRFDMYFETAFTCSYFDNMKLCVPS